MSLFTSFLGLFSTQIWLLIIFTILTTLYYRVYYTIWSKQGYDGPLCIPFLGQMYKFFYKSVKDIDAENYQKYGPVFGTYEGTTPILFVAEPELIRKIFLKDAHLFTDRHTVKFYDKILTKVLTVLTGEQWKRARRVVTPTFTSGKLKRMYSMIYDSSESTMNALREQLSETKPQPLDCLDFWGKYTLAVIARCCFATSIENDRKSREVFLKNADYFSSSFADLTKFLYVCPRFITENFQPRFKVHEAIDFFTSILTRVIDERNVQRKISKDIKVNQDFLDLILEAREEFMKEAGNSNIDTSEFSDDFIMSQSILFLVAGYFTTSIFLSFCSHTLAVHPDIQEKLHTEITENFSKDEKMDYDKLIALPYLDAFINEALRLYPILFRNARIAAEEYYIEELNLTVPKGAQVIMLPLPMHMDKKYFPQPELFRPERFLSPEKERIVPYSYLPFGLGPRNCIGKRFALLEAKLALAKVVMNFRVVKSANTDVPLQFLNGKAYLAAKRVEVGLLKRV